MTCCPCWDPCTAEAWGEYEITRFTRQSCYLYTCLIRTKEADVFCLGFLDCVQKLLTCHDRLALDSAPVSSALPIPKQFLWPPRFFIESFTILADKSRAAFWFASLLRFFLANNLCQLVCIKGVSSSNSKMAWNTGSCRVRFALKTWDFLRDCSLFM